MVAKTPQLSLAKRLGFSMVLLLGALCAVEATVRLLPEGWVVKARTHPDAVLSDGMVPSDAVPGWDVRPGEGVVFDTPYSVNAFHMRGPVEGAPGATRIAVVGDSSIFGVGLAWEETFSGRLMDLRSREGATPALVNNCAAPGHSSYQSVFKLERQCMDWKPDLVVIANHHSDCAKHPVEDFERYPERVRDRVALRLRGLGLYRLLRTAVWALSPPETGKAETIAQLGAPSTAQAPRVNATDYVANLHRLVAIARDGGAEPVIWILPVRNDVAPTPGSEFAECGAPYRLLQAQVAAEAGVQLIDSSVFFSGFSGNNGLFMDPVHPDVFGAELLARQLDAELPTGD